MLSGRQTIVALIAQHQWKRIWLPVYFCYEVVDTIRQTGIELLFYPDYPGAYDQNIVSELPYKKGDVLLRMNYFGLRTRRSNQSLPIPVIEDHSHDLLGRWSLYSDADWCIASIRKTLPTVEGGMVGLLNNIVWNVCRKPQKRIHKWQHCAMTQCC